MRNERGAILTEYSLMMALMSALAFLALQDMGRETKQGICHAAYLMTDIVDAGKGIHDTGNSKDWCKELDKVTEKTE